MFEKHRNNKPEPTVAPQQPDSFSATANAPATSGRSALIGAGIHINGDISGDENLVIEGKVDGKIRLDMNQVDVGQSGRVNADITAKVIKIAVRSVVISPEPRKSLFPVPVMSMAILWHPV